MPRSADDGGGPAAQRSGEPTGFAPGAIVERAVLGTTRRGERLITTVRLAAALGFVASWPLTAWLQPGVAPRQRALAGVAALSAVLSLASLWWLRRRTPGLRFLALAVVHDVALASGLLVVGLLWQGPWYVGSLSAPGMPSLCIVMVLAGLRLSRSLAALGIGLGWAVTFGLVALDQVLYGERYRPTPDIAVGVALNLLAASLTAWATSTRARKLIDEAAELAAMAARAAQRLGAYLPPAIAEAALTRDAAVRGVERREVTVLFTRLAPAARSGEDPAEVVAERNRYFRALARCVDEAGGIVDSFRHDGAMVVFGATAASEDSPARRALAAAEAIGELVATLTPTRGRGHSIGVHHGTVALGDVGTRDRLTYTAIGDVVNVAARIASLAGSLGTPILVSEATRKACDQEDGPPESPAFEPQGELPLRGRRETVGLWVPLPRPSTSAPRSVPEGPASWDRAPTSRLLAGRWERGAGSRPALGEADATIERAASEADAMVARVRLGVGAVALLLAPLLTGAHAPDGVLAYRVIGSVAVLSAVGVLVYLRRGPSSRMLDATVLLDAILVAGAVYTVMTWDRGHYRGVYHVVAFGLMYVIILLGGLRLRARTVLYTGALGAMLTAGLLALDAARGNPAPLHNVITLFILIAASTAIGYAAAKRTVGLVRAVDRQARDAARARSQLGAYASEEVAEQVLRTERLELGGRSLAKVAVIASDLRGFTSTAEDLDPADLVAQLNAYFEAMAAPIREQRGVIDSFVGDAILVVFGAPEPTPQPTLRAIRTAIGMHRALEGHNAERADAGLPPLRHGIGVDVGPAVAGHLGTETRAIYTLVGDVMVNAEAIEAATKRAEATILVSDAALDAANDEAVGAPIPPVTATLDDPDTGLRLHVVGPDGTR